MYLITKSSQTDSRRLAGIHPHQAIHQRNPEMVISLCRLAVQGFTARRSLVRTQEHSILAWATWRLYVAHQAVSGKFPEIKNKRKIKQKAYIQLSYYSYNYYYE